MTRISNQTHAAIAKHNATSTASTREIQQPRADGARPSTALADAQNGHAFASESPASAHFVSGEPPLPVVVVAAGVGWSSLDVAISHFLATRRSPVRRARGERAPRRASCRRTGSARMPGDATADREAQPLRNRVRMGVFGANLVPINVERADRAFGQPVGDVLDENAPPRPHIWRDVPGPDGAIDPAETPDSVQMAISWTTG